MGPGNGLMRHTAWPTSPSFRRAADPYRKYPYAGIFSTLTTLEYG